MQCDASFLVVHRDDDRDHGREPSRGPTAEAAAARARAAEEWAVAAVAPAAAAAVAAAAGVERQEAAEDRRRRGRWRGRRRSAAEAAAEVEAEVEAEEESRRSSSSSGSASGPARATIWFVVRPEDCERDAGEDEERQRDQCREPGPIPARRWPGASPAVTAGAPATTVGASPPPSSSTSASSVGRAVRGVLRQRALGYLGERGGSVRAHGGQRRRRFLELAAKHFDGARATRTGAAPSASGRG